MSDEDSLLTAIAAHPAEDTPRLMYADWLQESGRPVRAEFIRVQVEIARKDHLPRAVLNRYVDLFRRNQELIDDHRAELLGPLAALPDDVRIEFRRGFAESVELPVGTFLAHAALIAGQRPLPRVAVTGVVGRLHDFLLNPHTGCVTHLGGYTEQPEQLPDYPGFELDLIDGVGRLVRLEALDLEGCGVTDLHCDLADNFSVPLLRTLDLSNNRITDRGVTALLRTDWPQHLTHLILGGNEITDAGAVALAAGWPTGDADRLKHLNLRFTPIGQAGHVALTNRFGGRVDLF
jgi:uncharacterized protein (TIGR02996 family)